MGQMVHYFRTLRLMPSVEVVSRKIDTKAITLNQENRVIEVFHDKHFCQIWQISQNLM